ncbi:TPA: hypothetical protein HA251_05435 [Candidatus Woesearchaeota archaeon]|nr:hypothetical protein [Candidatus Woesearchaeota archaeon]
MQRQTQRKLVAALVIVSFVLLVASILLYMDRSHEQRQLDPVDLEAMTKDQILKEIYDRQSTGWTPFYYFIPIFAFFGVAVGALMYYLLAAEMERKDETIKHNAETIFKLLDQKERAVMRFMVENGGNVQQYEISHLQGFTKVKAHRVVQSLVEKGVIRKDAMGKMRRLRLESEFYEILRDKKR